MTIFSGSIVLTFLTCSLVLVYARHDDFLASIALTTIVTSLNFLIHQGKVKPKRESVTVGYEPAVPAARNPKSGQQGTATKNYNDDKGSSSSSISSSSFLVRNIHYNANNRDGMIPRYTRLDNAHDKDTLFKQPIEAIWQPPSTEYVKGIFFLVHGCVHQGTDFFYGKDNGKEKGESDPEKEKKQLKMKGGIPNLAPTYVWTKKGLFSHDNTSVEESELIIQQDSEHHPKFDCLQTNSRKCHGWPVEVKMARDIRARGYYIISASGGRGFKTCWATPPGNQKWDWEGDARRARCVLEEVIYKKEKIHEFPRVQVGDENGGSAASGGNNVIPIFAMGASGGGCFMDPLGHEFTRVYKKPLTQKEGLSLRCLIPTIAGVGGVKDYPTLWVHMPRDKKVAKEVRKMIDKLNRNITLKNDKTIELVRELLVPPVAPRKIIQDVYRHKYTTDLIIEVFEKIGLVNKDNGMLNREPRLFPMSKWVHAIRQLKDTDKRVKDNKITKEILDRDPLSLDESFLDGLLATAWGRHAWTPYYTNEILDFCEQF